MRLLRLQNIRFYKQNCFSEIAIHDPPYFFFYYFSCSCGTSLGPLVSVLRSQLYLLYYPLITY
jgi:hypothetical protein